MSLKNIIQNNIVDVLESAKGDRSFYMGIAIILVILFHSQGFISDFPILKVFIFGSIGVDVFLFLSGLGLCYSLTNHTTGNFYLRRFIRIFPLFLIFALIKSLYTVKFDNIVLSPFDWFCNLTTISYYRVGGTFIDWYISALILLYLLFPIFYRITNLKSMLLVTCFITVCYMGGDLIGHMTAYWVGFLYLWLASLHLDLLKNYGLLSCYFGDYCLLRFIGGCQHH